MIAAHGASVACHRDGAARHAVADEVADGEVLIQLHVGSGKGEATRNFHLQLAVAAIECAQQLGGALAFRIGVCRIERVGSTRGLFANVRERGRLRAVDGARAEEEKFACVGRAGKLQTTAGAFDDGVEHQRRLFVVERRAGVGGGVDDVAELSGGKREAAHVALGDLHLVGQVRHLAAHGGRVAGQNRHPRPELQGAVGVQKALHQPAAEEAAGAREEDPLATHLLPQGEGLAQAVFQVFAEQFRHFDSQRAREKSGAGDF